MRARGTGATRELTRRHEVLNQVADHENRGKPFVQQRLRCCDKTNQTCDRASTGYRLAERTSTTSAYSFGDEAKDLCTYEMKRT
jgi:hypothetical protein